MFNFCNNVIFEVSIRDGGSITCIFVAHVYPQEYKCLPRSCQGVIFQLKNHVHLVSFKVRLSSQTGKKLKPKHKWHMIVKIILESLEMWGETYFYGK